MDGAVTIGRVRSAATFRRTARGPRTSAAAPWAPTLSTTVPTSVRALLFKCAVSTHRLYVCVRNYIGDGGRSSAISLQEWVANRSILLCSRGKVVSDTLKVPVAVNMLSSALSIMISNPKTNRKRDSYSMNHYFLLIKSIYFYEEFKEECLSDIRERNRFKKKEVRDVIARGFRWTEAMRVVRSHHPEVTVIMPEEKIQLRPGDDVRALITPYVGVIRRALNGGVGHWHGYTSECQVRQVRIILSHYFHYHDGCISESELNLLIEDLLYIHKAS